MSKRVCVVATLLLTAATVAHADTATYFARGPEGAGFLKISLPAAAGLAKRTGTIQGSYRTFGKRAGVVTLNEAATWKTGSSVILSPSGSCAFSGQVGQCNYAGSFFTLTQAPDISNYAILFVPGLSTNQWNNVGVPYMDENVATAQALGFNARRLGIRTENGVLANAQYIAAEITAEAQKGRRVIVIAHSKGATDTTAALSMNPNLRAVVAGVVAIQPVFYGSPVADFVASKKYLLMPAVKFVFETLFKGQASAVSDISATNRAAFLTKYPYPASQIRTVVVRSTFNRPLGSKSILWANQKAISLATHADNDGMVRVADSTIPGAAVTMDIANMDHFEPGLRGESETSPAELTKRAIFAIFGLK